MCTDEQLCVPSIAFWRKHARKRFRDPMGVLRARKFSASRIFVHFQVKIINNTVICAMYSVYNITLEHTITESDTSDKGESSGGFSFFWQILAQRCFISFEYIKKDKYDTASREDFFFFLQFALPQLSSRYR